MASLVYGSYYHGVPKDQIPALEAVTQATVSRLYDHVKALVEGLPDGGTRSFNDADYRITRRGTALLYEDISAGWWAVLALEYPEADHPCEEYRETVDFKLFARQKKPLIWVRDGFNKGKVPWKQLDTEFMYGRCSMYFNASRKSASESWYCPLHDIDFKHPLLMNLGHAVEEVQERPTPA